MKNLCLRELSAYNARMARKSANLTLPPAVRDTLARYTDDEDISESGLVSDLLKGFFKEKGIEIREGYSKKGAFAPTEKAVKPSRKKKVAKRAMVVAPIGTIFRDIYLGDAPAGVPCVGEFRPESWEERQRVNVTKYPHAAFCLRVRGHSMTGRKIKDGDILIFALPDQHEPAAGDVVAACIDGEVTIKTLVKTNGKTTLKAENSAYPDPIITKNSAVQGVMIGKLATKNATRV